MTSGLEHPEISHKLSHYDILRSAPRVAGETIAQPVNNLTTREFVMEWVQV